MCSSDLFPSHDKMHRAVKTIKSIPNKKNNQNKQKKKQTGKNKASRNSGNRATLVLSAHRMYAINIPLNTNRQINTILNLSLFP